jgi:hypothetical protein
MLGCADQGFDEDARRRFAFYAVPVVGPEWELKSSG